MSNTVKAKSILPNKFHFVLKRIANIQIIHIFRLEINIEIALI